MSKPIHMNISAGRKADVILAMLTPAQRGLVSRDVIRAAFEKAEPTLELIKLVQALETGPRFMLAGATAYSLVVGLIHERGWNRTV